MPTHVTLYFTAKPTTTGTTIVAIPSGPFSALTSAPSPDIKVLNFALALETLEAELYRQAALRLGPVAGGTDMFGKHITGLGGAATDLDLAYVIKFGAVEAEHQAFLTAVLGGNWVTSAGALFDFGFADTNNFGTAPLSRQQTLQLIYAAEQTGVSAYLGGAGPGGLAPGGTNLAYAASILGTEARHTATVAITLNALYGTQVRTAPLVYPVKDLGTDNGPGLDTALAPDAILYGGGQVAADTTVSGTGRINPISGPNGFVFVATP